MSTFKVGDRVKFADAFIQSVQAHDLAHFRGYVTQVIHGKGRVPARLVIHWDTDDSETRAVVKNIAHARRCPT